MKQRFFHFIFLSISISLLFSCGSNNGKAEVDPKSDSVAGPVVDSNNLRVFTLPAPLQVATLLKSEKLAYNEKLLVPSRKAKVEYPSNYIRALNLGVYTIDLAYATVYEQHQTTLNYVNTMQSLVQELGISSGVSGSMVKRFENNIKKQDSLYHIILQAYSQANAYFQNNKREEVGMYILSGSYLEGLYISLHYKEIPNNMILRNLIGQQKLFLENIVELLQYTEDKPETVDLLRKLMIIKKEFDQIPVIYDDSDKGRVAVKCTVSQQQLVSMLSKVIEIRNGIIMN